jgi:hypothetical protein
MARPLLGYYPVKRSDLYKDKELWTKTSGCLIKDFRHDEKGVTPKCFYQGSAVFKSMDSR